MDEPWKYAKNFLPMWLHQKVRVILILGLGSEKATMASFIAKEGFRFVRPDHWKRFILAIYYKIREFLSITFKDDWCQMVIERKRRSDKIPWDDSVKQVVISSWSYVRLLLKLCIEL
jgi:hypothetical protein